MTKIAMVLGHDLLIPNEDTRVYREALALIKAGYEVTVFCWSRRLEKYDTKWEVERDGIKVVRIFEDLKGGVHTRGIGHQLTVCRRDHCQRSALGTYYHHHY